MGELLHHLQALPALARVGAGEDLTRGGGEDRLGLAPTDRYAVDVWVAQPHKRELKHMNHDSQDQHGLPVKWCCETITTIFRRVPCWSKAMIPTVLSSYKRYPSWGTPGRRRSCRVCLPTSPSRPGPSRPFSACEVW